MRKSILINYDHSNRQNACIQIVDKKLLDLLPTRVSLKIDFQSSIKFNVLYEKRGSAIFPNSLSAYKRA